MVSLISSEPMRVDLPTLRLRFCKVGRLQFISHLDVLRTFIKALRRAELPLYYTEGFSPHPKLVFATSLSLGQESVCEYLDVRLTEPRDPAAAMAALNAVLPPDLRILSAGTPAVKFTEVAFSSYAITVKTEGADPALAARCEAILNQKPLIVFKRSKAGDRDTDISEGVREATVSFENGDLQIRALLAADSMGFLNPDYLITVLKRDAGILTGDPTREALLIRRTALYNAEGETFTDPTKEKL